MFVPTRRASDPEQRSWLHTMLVPETRDEPIMDTDVRDREHHMRELGVRIRFHEERPYGRLLRSIEMQWRLILGR